MPLFNPSDKVVCVADPFYSNSWKPEGELPRPGRIYCVSEVLDEDRLVLVGSTLRHRASGMNVGWSAHCFRKIQHHANL